MVQVKGHPETVRLIGVDTPETKDPRKPVELFGKEASQFTASLLKGQRVRLEIQTVPTSRDRYGRLLAYVFRESDNLLVNKEIIRQGYGHAYTKYPIRPGSGWRSSGQRSGRHGSTSGGCGDRPGNLDSNCRFPGKLARSPASKRIGEDSLVNQRGSQKGRQHEGSIRSSCPWIKCGFVPTIKEVRA